MRPALLFHAERGNDKSFRLGGCLMIEPHAPFLSQIDPSHHFRSTCGLSLGKLKISSSFLSVSVMEAAAQSSTHQFVADVAHFGGEISHVLHNFASLKNHLNRNLVGLLGNLNATVHTLNQLASLITRDEQVTILLNEKGLKYVETLVEETSIAMVRIKVIVTEGHMTDFVYAPQYWKSFVSIDNKGHKKFIEPQIDEATLFRDLDNVRSRTYHQMEGTTERLEELQLLLLMVVQVMTIRDLTNRL
jgi:hypothetical protein